MRTDRENQPLTHFLSIGGLDVSPLCGAAGGPQGRPQVTAMIEQVTCPDCARLLNAMLAGALNREMRRR